MPPAAPSACSKLSFPPPTTNLWIKEQSYGCVPIPFPTSSPQIQAERRAGQGSSAAAWHSQYVTQLGQLLLGHLPLLLGVPIQVQEVVLPVQTPQTHSALCSAEDKGQGHEPGHQPPARAGAR